MKSRTCPNCGHQYSFFDYYKKLIFKLIDSKWKCAKCGSELTFSVGRRTLLAIISMIPIGFNGIITRFFTIHLDLSRNLSFALFVLIFIIWALFVYSFDSFEVLKQKE
ncbi:MAG: hypothetical protein H6538_03045 [Bacteroidales bacterium]|nr:hypothetical protein [Bacteroidales bacterium]